MRTWISDWDKTNITQAWVVITCVMISLALGLDEVNADNVDRSNSTSNEVTHSQDGFNAPFSFLMPRIGDPLNSTESPELTTQNQKHTVPLTTTLKVSNATLVGNSATGLTKQEVISSTTAQSEITTNQAIYSTTITDIAPTVNSTTTPLLKTTSTQTSTQTRNNSSISKSTVKSGQTNNTSALESFSSSDLTSISTSGSTSFLTSGLKPFSTSGPKYTDSSTVTNTQTVTNAKLIQTTQSSRLATINSTDETYNSTADPSRLTRTFSDDFQSPDSFWPIALALTIGIPTIVVLAITITVLYRRRMAKPRSLLSMYGQDYFNN